MTEPEEKWVRKAPECYVRGPYSIMRATYGPGWILRLHDSVFGLRVPSRYKTVNEAKFAADLDESGRVK